MDEFMRAAIDEARMGAAEVGVPIGSVLVKDGVIVGESETFAGGRAFMESHGAEVIDLDLDECKQLMADFIKRHPEIWNEDIGC